MTIGNHYRITIGLVMLLILLPCFLPGESSAIKKDAILKTSPEWQANYDSYQPEEGLLATLQAKIGENLSIDVYLGTWCGDSKHNVPPFIKILDALEPGVVTVTFFDVTRKASAAVKYFEEKRAVERVPTFIFYRDGQEVGRIVENPQKSLLEDFIEIVF